MLQQMLLFDSECWAQCAHSDCAHPDPSWCSVAEQAPPAGPANLRKHSSNLSFTVVRLRCASQAI